MLLAQCGRGLLRQAVQAPLGTRRLPLVVDLQAAINRFLAETNAEPKPFIWTAIPTKSSPPPDEGIEALDLHPLELQKLADASASLRLHPGEPTL